MRDARFFGVPHGEEFSSMSIELTDVFRAATLIQWGLQPRVRPIQNTEYRELIHEYLNRSDFRDVVAEMSDGLGLYVLNVSDHGIVLSPREESVFWMRASEFRPGNSSADMRLLDGLVQIAIAATIFPRAQDLEDDVNQARLPVTVEEIDDALRAICDRLKKQFADVDPNMDDIRTGLYDAWRVYDNALSARETKDGREVRSTTPRIIKYNLERLKEFGCFTPTRYAGKEAWQPTRRYNVLVQELAASRLFDEVMRIKNGDALSDEKNVDDVTDDAWKDPWQDDLASLESADERITETPEDGEAEFVKEEDDGEAEFVKEEDDGEADFVKEEDDGEADFVKEEDDGEA